MTDYKATSDQWNQVQKCADVVGSSDCSAILELRARVEALEANSKSTPNPSQIRSSLDLTPRQQEEIAALLRPDPKPVVKGSLLVTRVDGAVMESVKDQRSIARAAIREVAAWLIDRRRYDDWLAPFEELADLLLEEAER